METLLYLLLGAVLYGILADRTDRAVERDMKKRRARSADLHLVEDLDVGPDLRPRDDWFHHCVHRRIVLASPARLVARRGCTPPRPELELENRPHYGRSVSRRSVADSHVATLPCASARLAVRSSVNFGSAATMFCPTFRAQPPCKPPRRLSEQPAGLG
jgi:hypothetical protein